MAPVGDVIKAQGILHHQYADDTQLFFALKAEKIVSEIRKLESCSCAVRRWFLDNDLLLNADKSEVMLVGTTQQLAKVDKQRTVNVSDVALPILSKVKSLGVTLDSQLSFKSHVNAVLRACHYHIWALRHIRHLLTQDVAHTLARSIYSHVET